MNVTIFNSLTTDEVLSELEAESKNYTGLYVDMTNPPERKYVKEKAESINGLIKKLDRARIDKSKEYKVKVEAEAKEIKERLIAANLPFQSLIDEYKIKRAEELAAKKAAEESAELARRLPLDHDDAISMNEFFDFKREELKKEQAIRDDEIRKQAVIDAKINQEKAVEEEKLRVIAAQEAKEKQVEFERLQRESNKAHLAKINNEILNTLVDNGIEQEAAKKVIRLAAKGLIPNLTINY